MTDVPRIVLDTNVCLDVFVFRDPACAALAAALREGAVQAVTRADCREEWQRVLHYPRLPIDEASRPGLVAAFDAASHVVAPVRPACPLPRCADPDDQKFLELAAESGARWLLSKDKEVLRLAARLRHSGLFDILAPGDWSP